MLPHDDTKKPLPLTKDEGSSGLGIALVDEADVDVSSDSRYVPFNPKGASVFTLPLIELIWMKTPRRLWLRFVTECCETL